MSWRKVTRTLHVLLLLAATFALATMGLLLIRASRMVTKLQYTIENANRTIIIAGAGLREIHLSEQKQIEQFDATQKALTGTVQQLNKDSATLMSNANRSLGALHDTILTARQAIVDTNAGTSKLLAALPQNFTTLGETQQKLNSTLDLVNSKTVPALNAELMELHATSVQATGATRNLKDLLGNGNAIVAHYRKKVTTRKGIFGTVGHWSADFAAQVMADIVALKATGH